jgi:hypothetical protein
LQLAEVGGAELAVSINCDCHGISHSHAAYPSDERGSLHSLLANTDCIRLGGYPEVADINIVVACGKTPASIGTQGNIVTAGGIALKRGLPAGGVAVSSGVRIERHIAAGRVCVPRGIRKQRLMTAGSVRGSSCVHKQRGIAVGCV